MTVFTVAVLREGVVRLEAHPLPKRQTGEIDVAVTLAAVCGSDLHTVSGRRPAAPGTALGHEAVGVVRSVDPGRVDHRGDPLNVGDRVVFGMIVSCHACDRCLNGLPMKCRQLQKYGHATVDEPPYAVGMLADTVRLVEGVTVLRAPDIADELLISAACAVPTAQAIVQAVTKAQASTAGVIGGGAVGVYVAAMLADRGVSVWLQELDPQRSTIDEANVTMVTRLPDQLEATVEVSGSASGTRDAFIHCQMGGVVVLAGTVSTGALSIPFDPSDIVLRRLTVIGIHNYTPDDFVAGVDWLAHRRERAPHVASQTFPLARISDAFAAAEARTAIRIAVSP